MTLKNSTNGCKFSNCQVHILEIWFNMSKLSKFESFQQFGRNIHFMDIDMLCFVIDMDFDMICYVEIKDLKPIFCSKRKSLLESWKMYHVIIKIVFRLEFCLLSPPISFFWENIISAINCQRFEKSSPLIVHGYLLWNGKGGKGSPSMRAFYFYSEKESGTLGGIENAKFWRIFFQLSWTIFILVQYEFIIPSVRIRQPWKKYVTNISHKSLQNFLIISHFIFSIFFFRTENK